MGTIAVLSRKGDWRRAALIVPGTYDRRMTNAPARDYDALALDIPNGATRGARMRAVVDALWRAFQRREEGDLGVSWVGFYLGPGESHDGATAGPDQMVLALRQPKPACSPIGLHGACGQCYRARRSLVVTDVRNLGENYVACDPRDRSEVVVPCLDESGGCFGVLDLDSFDAGAFSTGDAAALSALLARAGLSAPRAGPGPALVY